MLRLKQTKFMYGDETIEVFRVLEELKIAYRNWGVLGITCIIYVYILTFTPSWQILC